MRNATARRLRSAVFASAPNAPAQVNELRFRQLKANWNATPSNHRHTLMLALEAGAVEMAKAAGVTTTATASSASTAS